jgi:hypothetical protein
MTGMGPVGYAGPRCPNGKCKGAGPWDFGQDWTDKILDSVYKWNWNIFGTSVPIGNITSGDMGLFNALATALVSGTAYQFYYGDQKSNAQAIQDRAFNCYDGAQIIIALAQAMGLSASMVSGSWDGTPHVWASVNGIPYDTTSMQQCGTWAPVCGRAAGPSSCSCGAGGIGRVTFERGSIVFEGPIYGEADFLEHIDQLMEKHVSEYISPNEVTGY